MSLGFTIALFASTYVLLLIFPKLRAYIALVSASIFVILGISFTLDFFAVTGIMTGINMSGDCPYWL
jgi:hypothetical protein